MQDQRAVHLGGQREIMRGYEHGQSLRTHDGDERLKDARRGALVQIAGRLVRP